MARKIYPDRLPDPVLVREGRFAIDNLGEDELPEDYADLVDDVLPGRHRDEDREPLED